MKQLQISKELEDSSYSEKYLKTIRDDLIANLNVKIEKRLIGELADGGLIEHKGEAYARFDETDIALELQGSGQHPDDRLLLFAVKAVRA